MAAPDLDAAIDANIGDDLLRLVFISCHPVLSTEARVALTLRLLGGLTTEEIARAFLVPEPTVAQRIVRAKRTLAEKRAPFEVPRGAELAARLSSVLEVVYLVFNEGYSATAGDDWMTGALRGRAPSRPHPGRAGSEGAGGPRPRRAHGDPGVALEGADRSVGRARVVARSRPGTLGSRPRPSWSRGARARRGARRRAGAVRAASRHRRLSRTSAYAGGDGLGAHRGALRSARPAHALPRRRAESRGRGRDGIRSGSGPRARRCADLGAGPAELPPLAERARRPPGEARPFRRSTGGVRARGIAHPQRTGARAAPRARRRVRTRIGTSLDHVVAGRRSPLDERVRPRHPRLIAGLHRAP